MRDHGPPRLGRARGPRARPAGRRPVDPLRRARHGPPGAAVPPARLPAPLARARRAAGRGHPPSCGRGSPATRPATRGRAWPASAPIVRTHPTTARPSWSSTSPRAPVREITTPDALQRVPRRAAVRRRRGGDPVAGARPRRRGAAAPGPSRRRVPLRVHGGRCRSGPARRGRGDGVPAARRPALRPVSRRALHPCRPVRRLRRAGPVLVLRHTGRTDVRLLACDGQAPRRLDRRCPGAPAPRPLDLRRARRVPLRRRPRDARRRGDGWARPPARRAPLPRARRAVAHADPRRAADGQRRRARRHGGHAPRRLVRGRARRPPRRRVRRARRARRGSTTSGS